MKSKSALVDGVLSARVRLTAISRKSGTMLKVLHQIGTGIALVLLGIAPLRGEAVRTLYLVRHGAYETEAKSAEGKALTPLGIAQARLVAARLRGMPVTFDVLIASTMIRATQTAEVIHEALPQLVLTSSDLLRECTPPTWRTEGTKDEKPEQLAAAARQLDEAFAKYFVPAVGADRHDVLVGHGNVIRYFVTKALGVDTKAWVGFSVAHCSLTIIQVKGDHSFKVLGVGDVGHIPPNLQGQSEGQSGQSRDRL